jgi:AraC-like DNA-binding protein
MLGLKENNPLHMLRQFAHYLNADIHEDIGAGKLVLDNNKGTGSITLYELFPGLVAWVYDMTFHTDFHIDMKFAEDRPYYFGFIVSGRQLQKFPHEEEYKEIQRSQNFILISEPGTESQFIIPKGERFRCCYLIINPLLFEENLTITKRHLRSNLEDVFKHIPQERPYRYFGKIDTNTSRYAQVIIKNSRTDIVGRLHTEGAVMNMLASQLESHNEDQRSKELTSDLRKSELSRITELGDFVKDNITEIVSIQQASRYLGLSPKKIQSGVRFLYGCSANKYMSNVRLEYAKDLIHTTDLSIKEISYSIGYKSRSYFSKMFFERFGVLPKEYQNSFLKDNLLFEVSYRSIANPNLSNQDIQNILEISRKENARLNITGSLIYHQNVFFQLIEGPKRNVLKVYEKIKKDDRHSQVETMWQGAKPERNFSFWSMALVSDHLELANLQHSPTKRLNLNSMMGDLDEKSVRSTDFWRRVRNMIKVS